MENRQRSAGLPQCGTGPQSLCQGVAAGSIVLVAHEHFGIDLAPGLSIKLNSAFVSDVLDIAGVEGQRSQSCPPGIRRTGERSRSLRHFVGRGGHMRPGAFKPLETAPAGGRVVDNHRRLVL
jgi:electron transfer flavoprotein alpha subunit